MLYPYRWWIGLILATLTIFRPVPAATTGSQVIINEVQWMGSSASSADEWLELRNLSESVVDLTGWVITKKSNGAEVTMVTIPAGKTIAAGGVFLISNYVNGQANTTLAQVPDVVTTDIALSNSALQLKLYTAAHELQDTADDGVGNPLAGTYDSNANVFASMERNPLAGDGTSAANWHTATRSLGFIVNAVERGTPGAANSNGQPLAQAGPDQSAIVGQALNFDGSDSTDPEGSPLIFAWDFGDGSQGETATPSHTFTASGTYTVTLTVSDGIDQAADTLRVTVTVPTAAPATPPKSATPLSEPVPEHVATSCHGLTFSELFPNPVGVDTEEYIELVNQGDEEVSITGCTVWTSATRKYVFHDEAVIPRGDFLVLKKAQTKLTLNNGGTTLRLLDSDGTELDRTTYAVAPEGQSWALIAGGWKWTTLPTPAAANQLRVPPPPPASSKKKTPVTAAPGRTPPAVPVALQALQDLDSGDRVIVSGVVTTAVGALGATMSYIQAADGAVAISLPNGTPAIHVGETVSVTGTVRLKQGRRYVTVSTSGLKVTTASQPVTPISVPTDDVGSDQADRLVEVHGVVSLASGNRLEIDDGSGPTTIYLKSSTGIIKPKVQTGDTVRAVGIVSVSTSGVRVLPRGQDDLHVERVLGARTAPTPSAVATSNPRQALWYWLTAAAGGIAVGAKPAWRAYRKKRADQL